MNYSIVDADDLLLSMDDDASAETGIEEEGNIQQ